MPAAFICSNSLWSSGLVAAGPNHHQRIMIRQSSGGWAKDSCSAATAGVGSDFCAKAIATGDNQRSAANAEAGIKGRACLTAGLLGRAAGGRFLPPQAWEP